MRGYKIAGYYDKTTAEWKPCMVFLEIPEDATIVRPEIRPAEFTGIEYGHIYTIKYSKKLRCNKARVLNIVDLEDGRTIDEALSIYILSEVLSMSLYIFGRQRVPSVTDIIVHARGIPGGAYRPDEVVSPVTLDTDATRECSSGIHFFSTEEDANEFYNDAGVYGGRRISWVAYILLILTESGRF